MSCTENEIQAAQDASPAYAIEVRAMAYREARDALRERAIQANADIEAAKRAHLPSLRVLVESVAQAEAALREAVQESPPQLWAKTRTRTVHGVRVGWTKQRGKVELADEARVIERIRKLLPAEQAELLIRVREAVHKPAVYDLAASDLKRLGIGISEDCDVVVVKDTGAELDKALEALLAQVASDAEEVQP